MKFTRHAGILFAEMRDVLGRVCPGMAGRVIRKAGTRRLLEPEDFLKLAERRDSWALMGALIGEGQRKKVLYQLHS
jgi:hypothetical protein